ncbi:MAG: choice-of-anchor Q domain-containing protein [Methylotetracoccus sp.]
MVIFDRLAPFPWYPLRLMFLLLSVMPAAADAATIIADGIKCTLNHAITAANTNAPAGGCSGGDDQRGGGDAIDLRSSVTLTEVNNLDAGGCGNGLPAITGILSIEGNGHAIVRSSAEGTPEFRLIDSTAGELTLSGLTLSNGASGIGGQGNACVGGGIRGAVVTLHRSVVVRNSALGLYWSESAGGGIYADAVTIADSTVSDNKSRYGGGIFGQTVVATNSRIHGNSVSRWKGGAAGGGIYGHTVSLIGSAVYSNRAWAAIEVKGGGIFGSEVRLVNSTVSGNSSFEEAVYGYGGGIYIEAGSLTLINSTVAANDSGVAGENSQFPVTGGGIEGSGSILMNSVVANNRRHDRFGISPSDCVSSAEYAGFNLIGDGSCGAAAAGQLTGDPKLGALAENGGPTQTHAVLPGSPAIDRIDLLPGKGCADSGVTTDQRGTTRPQPAGGKCDIGAFEFSPNVPHLALSKLPNRSNPLLLDGNLLVGNAYIFTTPDTGVSQLEFRLDGAYVRTEKYTPFDFASTAADGSAAPFNTAALSPGSHSVSARFKMTDGTVQTAGASFSIPGLYLSNLPDRLNPVVLNGQRVPANNLYIFASPDKGLKRAQFWIDDRWVRTENLSPFDFAGTAGDGTAYPFDGGTLTPGSHVIKALLTLMDGSTSKIYATFTRD